MRRADLQVGETYAYQRGERGKYNLPDKVVVLASEPWVAPQIYMGRFGSHKSSNYRPVQYQHDNKQGVAVAVWNKRRGTWEPDVIPLRQIAHTWREECEIRTREQVVKQATQDADRAYNARIGKLPAVLQATVRHNSRTQVVVNLDALEQIVEGRRSV